MGGDSYEIPAHPAMAWLGVLMNETAGWLDLFPGLAGDDAEDALFALIATADVDMDEVVTAAKQALAVVSGRPWWVAVRLVHVAFASWDYVSGEVVFRGVDAVRLSLSAWLDAVFHIILRSMDSKDHTKFLAQLEMPPAEERASLPEPEMSADAFKALMR